MMKIEEDIVVFAFRYALGRMTYAVETVGQYIIDNVDKLHPETLRLLAKEIREAIDCGDAGADMDVETWERVCHAAQKELQRPEK